MDLKKIKLIIWDLDETFWMGTLSEGEVKFLPQNVTLIQKSTDAGIVNSICSKNDFHRVKDELTQNNLWGYFVFPSIDWSAKGIRIKNLIDTMKLRYENVLFIDDNKQNQEEAKYYCTGLMTLMPDDLKELYEFVSSLDKKDPLHERLNQYHVLEKKEASREEFSSNDEFLMSCNIRVEISHDCDQHLERIYDLVIRSNQLNYTKVRPTKEELLRLLEDKTVNKGCVSARDRFGDYGIIGFFAIKGNKAIHYVFSCRTLGMQVEQYVYRILGCPSIDVVGSVVTELQKDFMPPWINSEIGINRDITDAHRNSCRILLKGPCDMSQMYTFLSNCENLTTEFSYTNSDGVLTEGHNHTAQIITALFASEEEKQQILDSFPCLDRKMFDTALKTEKFDYVVLSMLTDGNLGVYKCKGGKYEIALCEKYYDLTDIKNEEDYVAGMIFTSGLKFSRESLAEFRNAFTCTTDLTWDRTIENLDRIRVFLGEKTKLILILGSEHKFIKKERDSFRNRDQEHMLMNQKISAWAEKKENVILLPLDRYVRGNSDFIDTINHFTKRIYYELAANLVALFCESTEVKVKLKSKFSLYLSQFRQKLSRAKAKISSFKET